ncbi:MAG: hypothetical protein ACREBS_12070 [Nitrososphaerales archaeon]
MRSKENNSISSSTVEAEEQQGEEQFRKMYLAAVEYGLLLLGKELGGVTLSYLREKYEISVDQIFNDPKLLCLALENMLGFSSITIEKRILRYLYSQMGFADSNMPKIIIRLNHPQDFVNAIGEVRRAFDDNRLPKS